VQVQRRDRPTPATFASTGPLATSTSGDLEPGALVGDYRVERTLGRGGMGTVYEAVHSVIDKRVAIKLLHRDRCADPESVNRFVTEARAANRIGHRNIVDVFGFGLTTDGRSYLAMELLCGESLGDRIERGGLALDETCALLIEIGHALEAAHQSGIVHRDLKPDNVFLAEQPGGGVVVKLLDFGIAKLMIGGGPVQHTQPGSTIGTPQYIAPEQARGRALDGSADVYALGVIAFEMLTGRLPFESDNAIDLITQHIGTPPPRPSSIAPLPPIADALLLAMLDKTPANRPALPEVRAQLERLRSGRRRARVSVPWWGWVVGVCVALAAVVAVVDRMGAGAGAANARVIAPAADAVAPPVETTSTAATAPAAPALSSSPSPSPPPPPSPPPSAVVEPPPAASPPSRPSHERHPARRQPTRTVPSRADKPSPAAPVTSRPAPPAPSPSRAVEDDDALASPFPSKHP